MKIRTGFVSNSSSSSFCLLGIWIPEEKVSEDIHTIVEDLDRLDRKTTKESFLTVKFGITDDDTYIGILPGELNDEETLLEAKKRISEELNRLGIEAKPENLQFHYDGGYNG